jgi:hypothetical protein
LLVLPVLGFSGFHVLEKQRIVLAGQTSVSACYRVFADAAPLGFLVNQTRDMRLIPMQAHILGDHGIVLSVFSAGDLGCCGGQFRLAFVEPQGQSHGISSNLYVTEITAFVLPASNAVPRVAVSWSALYAK